MVNQYGQTDLTQALLAQGTSPSPYKTGLGQAARLGGVALAEWGKRKKADESRSALADALAGLNRGSLTGEGPTTDAAGRAPIGDPQLLARLLSDPNTAGVGQALLGRALQPAPKPDIRQAADGFLYNMRTGKRALPNVQQQPKQPNPTAAMQEYGLAKDQGYKGSFQQYLMDMKRAGASSVNTNVNTGDAGPQVGTIPQGYMLSPVKENGNTVGYTMAPVPGGPAAREVEDEERAAQNREEKAAEQANVVIGDIDRILDIVDQADIPVTGGGSFLAAIPGSAARDVAALLDTVKGNIGFNELNKMRQSSPTGGALGNVTVQEIVFLQSVAGSLEQSQSEDQFKRNLGRVKEAFKYVVDRSNAMPLERITSGEAEQSTPFQSANDVASAPVPEVRSFVEGATVEDLDALPEDVRNAIMQRLRGQ